MSAMNVYLKYFHGGGKSIDEMLHEFEDENKKKEEGVVNEEHINSLHLDAKENGGVGSELTIGFTSKSYRSAKKSKSKGRMWEHTVRVHQDKYSNTGNAWKVWDSSIVMARWCFSNRELFKDKVVHEVGSGCGLVGILASKFCKEITLSDYKDEILDNIKRNVQLNEEHISENDRYRVQVQNLDFQKVFDGSQQIKENERVDVVLGGDIIYGVHLSTWLPTVLNQLLKPDGVCYICNPKNRVGVDEFVTNMENLGFKCRVATLPEQFCEDFVKKSCWDIISCSRNAELIQDKKEEKISVVKAEDEEEDIGFGDSFFHHKSLKKDYNL